MLGAALRRATASRKAASTDVKDRNIPPLQAKQCVKYQITPPDASETLAWRFPNFLTGPDRWTLLIVKPCRTCRSCRIKSAHSAHSTRFSKRYGEAARSPSPPWRPKGLHALPFRHAAYAFSSCSVCLFAMQRFVFAMRRFGVPHGAFIDSASGREGLCSVRSTWPRRRGRSLGAALPTCRPHLLPKP